MTEALSNSYTSFDGHRRIASGSLQNVVLVVKRAIAGGAVDPILIFDDSTGRSIDIDMHGSEDDVLSRLTPPTEPVEADDQGGESRGRGRPKLGVVAREVTLLPRHWEWLASQPGGASVTLRKLVEEARRNNTERDKNRKSQECAYRFISAIAGDFENFEEASRALFAKDQPRFTELVSPWPQDVQDYAIKLAFGDSPSQS